MVPVAHAGRLDVEFLLLFLVLVVEVVLVVVEELYSVRYTSVGVPNRGAFGAKVEMTSLPGATMSGQFGDYN